MNDRMTPIPFDRLVEWVYSEYKNDKSIFGIPESKFCRETGGSQLTIAGRTIETPVGPAAGPHTQLAQNIVAAYLTGARYFELKTVQTLDGEDLPVSKPCILARDEGYNVEWSTELTVPDAYSEYVKAYFLLNVLSRELRLGSSTGFAFNMSVGYDLQGIQSPKIDAFIENLKNASKTPVWKACKSYLRAHLDVFAGLDAAFVDGISPFICDSITLSTLHGCPRQEIEKIAGYLLGVKKLNVYVKCNPTLLGYDFARKTLDALGFEYLAFDAHHFNEDLQYEDAVPMLKRLQSTARELKLEFGVKLTNTFPVEIRRRELPGDEMYMSGRALYPLTVTLAARLAESFNGDLRISYSGGADFFSVSELLKTGIAPVTVATTLLKPGGYMRLKQLAETAGSLNLPSSFAGVSAPLLRTLADNALKDAAYQKDYREAENRKVPKALPLTDCFLAPCKEGCPIGQDAPEYIRLAEEGRQAEAFALITSKNPFPFTTGTICAHPCMTKCTRMDVDKPVDIRAAKLAAAKEGYSKGMGTAPRITIPNRFRVAVIGAGPAGLSAAYFLAKCGADVTVFEKRETPGGIPAHIIPDFRLPEDALARDLELIKNTGVSFKTGTEVTSVDVLKRDGYAYIFIATGAWMPGSAGFGTDGGVVFDVLDFLGRYKSGLAVQVGKNVAVVGAGNSAMDAARAARRLPGVETVTIVYRRTRTLMPADREELHLALEDGVIFKELLSPVSYRDGVLKCQRLALGQPDASGRRSPVPLEGLFEELAADTVITAVGQKTDEELLKRNGFALEKTGRPITDPETNETSVPDVFAGGDLLRGPATIVEAIADGMRFAKTVLSRECIPMPSYEIGGLFDKAGQHQEITSKKGVLERAGCSRSGKCLECGAACNLCVEVCPNRANVAVRVRELKDINQVLHIDGLCNACGNCETFCPYESAPYKHKLTLYWNESDFDAGENQGFWISDAATASFKARIGGRIISNIEDLPADIAAVIRTVLKDYQYLTSLYE
jgi:putative selenate reductase